ncbi:sensor histidine kinase [Oceanibacterium hippocampi]|uniref:histidine kinase n=1 Tax=Oceanibacterium hippocampi TaxID=745714 RepID=A0A1Y5TRP5_9PROT|nr:HAMP domain-containing sensor histidine kinase [Oceanibacterium hippocampi]SLN70289.1 Non-motile and phage-resistance protein [Oceanibacterium hippocampi]
MLGLIWPRLADSWAGGRTQEKWQEAEVRVRQVVQMTKYAPVMTAFNVPTAMLTAAVLWDIVPNLALLAWVLIMAVPSAFVFYASYRKRNWPVPRSVSRRVVDASAAYALFLGSLWGAAGFFFFSTDSIVHEVFLAFVIGGLVAGVVPALSIVPAAYLFFSVPALTPLIIRFIGNFDQLSLIMALMAAMYLVAMISFARVGFTSFLDHARTKRDNATLADRLAEARANLVDAIESSSDAFALFDEEGRSIIKNTKYRGYFPEGRQLRTLSVGTFEQQLVSGEWLKSSNRRTRSGGIVSVHTSISELKAREAEAIEARRVAERANRMKSEFLALMSHELRTPLNAIIGFSDILKDELFGSHSDPRYKEYSLDIADSGRHLLQVINDILDLSKIEAGRFELSLETIDLRRIAQSAVRLLAQNAESGGIELRLEMPTAMPQITADSRAVKQMLVNLISNAVKFTQPGGEVVVTSETVGEEYAVCVRDTGIGIAADQMERVFEPFGQVDSGFSRKEEGTGLGVPLVRSLIELHGGRLTIESEVGTGTEATLFFRVKPPKTDSSHDAAAAGPGDPVIAHDPEDMPLDTVAPRAEQRVANYRA